MKNCLHAILTAFPRELARHLAARLGESESAVSKALRGMGPVVLCQTVIQTGQGEGKNIFALMKEVSPASSENQFSITEVLGLLGGNGQQHSAWSIGEHLLGRLFGPRLAELTTFMGAYAGIRPTSAKLLLELVATIQVLGLARCIARQDLNSAQFSTEMASVKNLAYSCLPNDLAPWPGYCRRTAVLVPHSVWAAELALPYWKIMLSAAALFVLVVMVLGALNWTPDTNKNATHRTATGKLAREQRLLLPPHDSLQFIFPAANRSVW